MFTKLNSRFNIISGPTMLEGTDLYSYDTAPTHINGALAWGPNGQAYRYGYVGAAALIKGNTLQEAAVLTTYYNMAIGTAAAVGDLYLQVTNGTSTITNAQYKDGTIGVCTSGTVLIGDEYRITAVTGVLTTGGALKVYTDRPVRYAFTTSAKVNMRTSPWWGMIQSTGTTATGIPIGVAIYELPINNWGWVQTHGEVTVLGDATTAIVGSDLALSVTVVGAAGLYAVASGRARIGLMRAANASGLGISAFLQID